MKLDLSELPIAPHQYRLAGLVLLGAGTVILIIGLLFAFSAVSKSTSAGNQLQAIANDCADRINQLGLKATVDGNKIRVTDPNISQAVALLAQSSQAVSLCPYWMLSQYCLGSGCKPAGLTMVLQYSETKN
jgi:hypothetical protein